MEQITFDNQKMAQLRVRRAITQGTLALQCGLAPETISRIERGTQQPRPATVREIADALRVDPSELYRD